MREKKNNNIKILEVNQMQNVQGNQYMEVEINDIIGLVSLKHWMIFILVVFAFIKGKMVQCEEFSY
jgi:hypothetical protein